MKSARTKVRTVALGLSIALSLPSVGAPPASADTPIIRNPGTPSYIVRLRSDRTGHDWRGTESISFTNLESAPLSDIWLRLWSNGVKDCPFHAIVVTHLHGGSAGPLSRNCTALPVMLDTAVVHDARATITMHVAIHLPARNDRFGYHRGMDLLGTALPTLAIHDDLGWHLDPFIDLGESFYSIVGNYRVTLNVPAALSTPTTGFAVSSALSRRRRITTYVAQHVRDFEWAAGHLGQVSADSGRTRVVVSYQRKFVTRSAARTALGFAVHSLNTYSTAFGSFPYPEMDVVLTGFTAFSGMEYPTIIFTDRGKLTISHELAHQYFYGIVGDDQFASPWLDESFATWIQYLPFGGWKQCAYYRWPSAEARITNDMRYWKAHPGEYDTIYSGGGCMLANLAHLFGLQRFVGILHDYAQAHWFGVVRTDDFKAAIAAAAAAGGVPFDPATYWTHWRVD